MPTLFTDTGDFITTTNLWVDENLTQKAPDGFYQKDGFYRRLQNGELLPAVVCDECIITTPCGQQTQFSGGQSYPDTQAFDLGTDTGDVTITFEAFNVPDRFITRYNDQVVSDTGYRGADSYDFGGSNRSSFNNSLTGKLDPITGLEYPDTVNFPDDGYPRVTSPGNGTDVFTKSLTSPATAFIDVYGPMSGTAWNVIMSCPVTETETEVAAILLSSPDQDQNNLCQNGDPSGAFSNIIYVRSDWDGFVLNGSSQLVVDNSAMFAQPDTEIYSISDPDVVISPNSVVSSTQTISPGDGAVIENYLVMSGSLANPTGTKITGNFVNTTNISFVACS